MTEDREHVDLPEDDTDDTQLPADPVPDFELEPDDPSKVPPDEVDLPDLASADVKETDDE